ncbi:GtrA family protein [Sphingorhabdus soli]|uniref:GtrA family protein n=1 Tax=Flavisphingopyxis soli TaxID=2601267 RepID=A0A5C6UMZ1_9SPHN|nr:GtrA family protein [Sphingorhabdus soli]TXC73486.1 GtrA family protein [Sphingorhabdus soli]
MKHGLLDFHRWTYMRYLGASVVALGADTGLFLLLLRWLTATSAAALGYIFGILIHWLISSRVVFAGQTATVGRLRHKQKMLFLASALAGLALTVGIVGVGELAGFDPRLAKGIAILVSFQATYLLRKRIVFRP